MTATQLELPLFETADQHSLLIRWHPVGKPDGTYTLTCACDGVPMISHTWNGWQVQMVDHCREGN